MKSKSIYAACLFAALNICAISAHADTVKPDARQSGSHLDIKKVLSSTQDSASSCEIVDSHLTYLNSQGETRTLNYKGFADICSTTN